jgi:hypothetical protein
MEAIRRMSEIMAGVYVKETSRAAAPAFICLVVAVAMLDLARWDGDLCVKEAEIFQIRAKMGWKWAQKSHVEAGTWVYTLVISFTGIIGRTLGKDVPQDQISILEVFDGSPLSQLRNRHS